MGVPGDLQAGVGPGRGAPDVWHHVVIPTALAVAVLGVVDLADIHNDAEPLKIVLKGQDPAIAAAGGKQQLKA